MRNTALPDRLHEGTLALRDAGPHALDLSSALLASVSHDLRNPLSVILGASEVLQDGFHHLGDDDRHSYLGAIRRECVRMDEYVQGILHATRLLVGGSAHLVRDWIGIDELVGTAVERLRRYREDVRISVEIASPLRPLYVNGVLVEQALLNVLDNAAKFSPAGATVHVRVSQCPRDGTRIDVIDAGPGIAHDQRERIFGLFVSDDPQSRGRAGSGLGLAISRSIVRAHEGEVVACDAGENNAGACVRITLPVREAAGRNAR